MRVFAIEAFSLSVDAARGRRWVVLTAINKVFREMKYDQYCKRSVSCTAVAIHFKDTKLKRG